MVLMASNEKVDDIEWSVVQEGHLFDAMVGHKPVGINRYFHMYLIWDRFTDAIQKNIDTDKIWKHLNTMYNLKALDQSESLPFPNRDCEFSLPDSDFEQLKLKKTEQLAVNTTTSNSGSTTRSSTPSVTNSNIKSVVEDEKKLATPKGRETPKLKDVPKKEERITPNRTTKDMLRRDSKDSNKSDNAKSTPVAKKDAIKKESDKNIKSTKSRSSSIKDDSMPGTTTPSGGTPNRSAKLKLLEETPKAVKRPLRGSLKPDDGNTSGKASPQPTQPPSKRRRI